MSSRNELAQDRTDRRFIGIPSPGKSQAQKAIAEFCENRNPSKATRNQHRIGIQIEHFPHPTFHFAKNPAVSSHNPEFQSWLAGHRLNPEKADRTMNAKNSLKGIFHDP